MSNSATSNPKFWLLAVGVYSAAATIVMVGTTPIVAYAHDQAAGYAADAVRQTSAATALLELQTAAVLDPGNPNYRRALANHYISQGDYNHAVLVLGNSVGERVRKAQLDIRLGRLDDALRVLGSISGPDAALARSQAYLEQGRGEAGAGAVERPSNDAMRAQLALCQAVIRGGGGVELAQELYASKLYQTTQRVLLTAPDSSAKFILLAHTKLNQQPLTRKNLLDAQAAAQQAAKLDPSSLPAHTLLQDVDSQIGDTAGAAHEQQLIDQLESGKV